MAYAYDASLIDRIMPKINQYQATTGGRITPQMLEALMRAELSGEVEKAKQSASLEKQDKRYEQELALRREQLDKEERAATIGGVTNLAGTGAMTYLGYKALTKPKIPTAPTTPAMPAPAYTPGVEFSRLGAGGTPMANAEVVPAISPASGYTVGGGYTLPAATEGAQAALTGAGVATAGGAQATLAPAAYASAPELAAGTGMGEGLAATFGAEAPTTAGAAGLGLGTVAIGAGLGLAGKTAASLVGANQEISNVAGGGIAGGIIGAATAVGGPVGAVIGGIVGLAAGELADTVICTELYRQGLVSARLRRVGLMFGARAGFDVYRGYLMLADPVVARMHRSRWYTRFVAFLAIPTMREMAHRLGCAERGTLLGKIVLAVGIPLCRWAYRQKLDGRDAIGEVA